MQHYRSRLPIPQAIADAPELLPWLEPVFSAFFELATCRNMDGPIPWTAIHLYAKANQYLDRLEWFTGLIRAMDSVYLQHISKKNKSLASAGKKKGAAVGQRRK